MSDIKFCLPIMFRLKFAFVSMFWLVSRFRFKSLFSFRFRFMSKFRVRFRLKFMFVFRSCSGSCSYSWSTCINPKMGIGMKHGQ
jgi:hypothetical protein